MNSVSDIFFSSVSFSVYYEFKSRMCDLRFEFILHLYSFFRYFLFFFIPVEGLCCRPEVLGKSYSSFPWSKLPNLQMHRKLGFIWKTYAQPAIGVIVMLPGWGPRGCAQLKAIEGQQISKFTLLGLNSWTALLLNLPESKLTRDCVSRLVRVRR